MQEKEVIVLSSYSCQNRAAELFFLFQAQSYTFRLGFSWRIRIYQTRKNTMNKKGRNFKFSRSDAVFLIFQASSYFENFFLKT